MGGEKKRLKELGNSVGKGNTDFSNMRLCASAKAGQ